jgi:triosephosphate isomerase (TIM)
MSRIPLAAGNWKMNKTVGEGVALVEELCSRLRSLNGVEVVVCPPATALHAVGQALQGSSIALGAQDVFWEEKGAYTGMLAPKMLLDVGCVYVIVGHSERRGRFGKADPALTPPLATVFGDNDSTVNTKAKAALAAGLRPIICVGETLKEREDGFTDEIVSGQLQKALEGLPFDRIKDIVLAYEPVWAIGTGKVCDSAEADRVLGMMRTVVASVMGSEAAAQIRILYGGSVTADNSKEIMAQKEIDGVLVGGASLIAENFAKIAFSALKR